jgi:hypothetical protein
MMKGADKSTEMLRRWRKKTLRKEGGNGQLLNTSSYS